MERGVKVEGRERERDCFFYFKTMSCRAKKIDCGAGVFGLGGGGSIFILFFKIFVGFDDFLRPCSMSFCHIGPVFKSSASLPIQS